MGKSKREWKIITWRIQGRRKEKNFKGKKSLRKISKNFLKSS